MATDAYGPRAARDAAAAAAFGVRRSPRTEITLPTYPRVFVSSIDNRLYAGQAFRGPSLNSDGSSYRLYRSTPNFLKTGNQAVQTCRAGECLRWLGPTYPLRVVRDTPPLQNRPYIVLNPVESAYSAIETFDGVRVVTKAELLRTFAPRMIGMVNRSPHPLDGVYAFFFEDGLYERGIRGPGNDAALTNARLVPVVGVARTRYAHKPVADATPGVAVRSFRDDQLTLEIVGAAIIFKERIQKLSPIVVECTQQIWNTPIAFPEQNTLSPGGRAVGSDSKALQASRDD